MQSQADAAPDGMLGAIFQRRAIRTFKAVEIPASTRDLLLQAARQAPSSFNMQPYRLFWVESPEPRITVANLCMTQSAAETASALVVAVADISSLQSTAEMHAAWMRQAGFSEEKIRKYERTATIGRILFMPGPLNLFAALKGALFRLLHIFKRMGVPPLTKRQVLTWATKSTALACQNLMICAEVVGLNTCPMEGFDGPRLARLLGLKREQQEIVMIIAIGKKSAEYIPQPQWRRPLGATVTIL
jgi:nitroreductase